MKLKAIEKEKLEKEINNLFKNNERDLKVLLIYASFRLKNTSSFDYSSKLTPEDVIQEIIEKLLTNKRKRAREAHPDFMNFMKMAIASFIKNENKRIHNTDIMCVDLADEGNTELIKGVAYDGNIDTENNMLIEKINVIAKEFNEDERKYFELMKAGMKNMEICKNMKMCIERVENIQKRVKRKLRKAVED